MNLFHRFKSSTLLSLWFLLPAMWMCHVRHDFNKNIVILRHRNSPTLRACSYLLKAATSAQYNMKQRTDACDIDLIHKLLILHTDISKINGITCEYGFVCAVSNHYILQHLPNTKWFLVLAKPLNRFSVCPLQLMKKNITDEFKQLFSISLGLVNDFSFGLSAISLFPLYMQ